MPSRDKTSFDGFLSHLKDPRVRLFDFEPIGRIGYLNLSDVINRVSIGPLFDPLFIGSILAQAIFKNELIW